MKEEQDKLEKHLWEERESIRRSHEEKVKVAKDKYATGSLHSVPIPTVFQGKDDRSRLVEAGSAGEKHILRREPLSDFSCRELSRTLRHTCVVDV
jgi:hypothetical protein